VKTYRLEEDPTLRAFASQPIGDGKNRRDVVWIVSAGEALDADAHRRIWKRGSAAESCALHGDSHYWERGGQPQGR
jgi:hypothetical protein